MAGKKRQKEKRYLESGDMRWRVPNAEWGEYIKRGLLERVSARIAHLRQGVEIVWEEGRHLLRDRARRLETSIPSSWRLVERAAMFDVRGPRLTPSALQREIQADYCSIGQPAWEAA